MYKLIELSEDFRNFTYKDQNFCLEEEIIVECTTTEELDFDMLRFGLDLGANINSQLYSEFKKVLHKNVLRDIESKYEFIYPKPNKLVTWFYSLFGYKRKYKVSDIIPLLHPLNFNNINTDYSITIPNRLTYLFLNNHQFKVNELFDKELLFEIGYLGEMYSKIPVYYDPFLEDDKVFFTPKNSIDVFFSKPKHSVVEYIEPISYKTNKKHRMEGRYKSIIPDNIKGVKLNLYKDNLIKHILRKLKIWN